MKKEKRKSECEGLEGLSTFSEIVKVETPSRAPRDCLRETFRLTNGFDTWGVTWQTPRSSARSHFPSIETRQGVDFSDLFVVRDTGTCSQTDQKLSVSPESLVVQLLEQISIL